MKWRIHSLSRSVNGAALGALLLLWAVGCDDTVVVRARYFSEDALTEEMRACQENAECVIADVNCGCDGPGTVGYRAAVQRDHVGELPQECGAPLYGYQSCKSCDEWVRPTCYLGTCELTLTTEESCENDPECGAPRFAAEEMKEYNGAWPYDY